MQRIAIGILILCLIALCGILFVESSGGSSPPPQSAASDRTLKFMMGGDTPSQPGDDAAESHEKVAKAAQKSAGEYDAGAKKPPKTPWRAPDPVFHHKVVKGDNPTKIAAEYFGAATSDLVARILKANNLKSAKDLKIDTVLKIPVDHFESVIADGRFSVRSAAKRIYKTETTIAPLRHANPSLPKDLDSPIPVGFTVFIPR